MGGGGGSERSRFERSSLDQVYKLNCVPYRFFKGVGGGGGAN